MNSFEQRHCAISSPSPRRAPLQLTPRPPRLSQFTAGPPIPTPSRQPRQWTPNPMADLLPLPHCLIINALRSLMLRFATGMADSAYSAAPTPASREFTGQTALPRSSYRWRPARTLCGGRREGRGTAGAGVVCGRTLGCICFFVHGRFARIRAYIRPPSRPVNAPAQSTIGPPPSSLPAPSGPSNAPALSSLRPRQRSRFVMCRRPVSVAAPLRLHQREENQQ